MDTNTLVTLGHTRISFATLVRRSFDALYTVYRPEHTIATATRLYYRHCTPPAFSLFFSRREHTGTSLYSLDVRLRSQSRAPSPPRDRRGAIDCKGLGCARGGGNGGRGRPTTMVLLLCAVSRDTDADSTRLV